MDFTKNVLGHCVAALIIASLGCQEGGSAVGSSSPEHAFNAMQEAGNNKDFKKMFAIFTPGTQDKFTGAMLGACAMMKMMSEMTDEEAAAAGGQMVEMKSAASEAMKLAERSGVTDEMLGKISPMKMPNDPSQIEGIGNVKDKAGFVSEMLIILENSMGEDKGIMNGMDEATIADIKIDGDSAVGTVTMNGRDQEYKFMQLDGSWRVDVPMK